VGGVCAEAGEVLHLVACTGKQIGNGRLASQQQQQQKQCSSRSININD